MKRLSTFAVALLAVAASSSPSAQQARTVTLSSVAGPVSVIQGSGGNVGVVADARGLLLIDAKEEADTAAITNAVKSLAGGDHVRLVVNTHWHSDHTGGNATLGAGAVIIAQEHVRDLLTSDQTIMGRVSKALPSAALPSITYADALTVYAGGEAIRLVHYPRAHTDGDTVVFFDRLKVVHMGDMYFNGMFPFLDVTHGGNIDNWVKQLDAIISRLPADAKIIPGHGPVSGVAGLTAFRQMLADSADTVRTQMKSGKTLEQIQAAGLPPRFDPWTKGFLTPAQWIELVYRSLEKPAR